jgi:hypothetical protein
MHHSLNYGFHTDILWHISSQQKLWSQEKQPTARQLLCKHTTIPEPLLSNWLHTTLKELLDVMFSTQSALRLHRKPIVHCELVWLEVSQELTAEVGGWQLEVSPAQELAPEGNTS